jgi:Cys-tRNA(Pro) deacylase
VGSTDYPVTTAVRALKAAGIPFVSHLYSYEEHGGTAHAARSLGVDEHSVIKTLVMEADGKKPLLVLMHGDREVSTKQLARTLGVKRVVPCDPQTAHRHTGYMVGGISPFGTRSPLPVAVEVSLLSLERIYINGGKRGFLVEIDPSCLTRAFPGLFRVSVGRAPGTLE